MSSYVRNLLRLLMIYAIFFILSLVVLASVYDGLTLPVLRLAVNAFVLIPMVIVLWRAAEDMGMRDLKADELEAVRLAKLDHTTLVKVPKQFHPMNGFTMGLIIQAPFILLTLIGNIPSLFYQTTMEYMRAVVVAWFSMFSEVTKLISIDYHQFYLFICYALFFIVVTGVAYYNGQWKKIRIHTEIERNEKRLTANNRVHPRP